MIIQLRESAISLEDVRNQSAIHLLEEPWTERVLLRASFEWFIQWLNSCGTQDAWEHARRAFQAREAAKEARARAWQESRRRMHYTTVSQHTWISSPFEA